MPTLDPRRLFELGRRLAPLRDDGTLIIGSGFTTHNLRWFNPAAPADAPPPSASREFDDWSREALEAGDVDALLDFAQRAPAAREAHPRTEHFAPLFVSLGAASGSNGGGTPEGTSAVEGFWFGLSKRSWQFS
jgi:4,5-DOPA dioxygenase extradiol